MASTNTLSSGAPVKTTLWLLKKKGKKKEKEKELIKGRTNRSQEKSPTFSDIPDERFVLLL